MKLLRWIFSLTYCEYNGSHYVLDCGPIGLSVVGEVAIIYMEEFQMKAKSVDFPELNDWPWYVDDSVLKCQREKASQILDHLNSIEPDSIKFTKEEEEDNKLPVLDLELNVNRKTKKVEFNVHYKGVDIINGEYPPGVFFKGSQIFEQKNKGSQIFRRKFKGSQINFKV